MLKSWRGLLMNAEAMTMLTIARFGIAVLPSGKLSVLAGPTAGVSSDADAPPEVLTAPSRTEFASASPIRARLWAVRHWLLHAADQLPWHSSCLVLAIAGQLMLRRRRVPSVVQLGVRSEHGVFMAHAWLVANNMVVIGGEETPDYHPLATFGRTPRSTRSGT